MSVTVNIAGDFCITPAFVKKDLVQEQVKEIFNSSSIIYFSSNAVAKCSIVSVSDPLAIMKKFLVSV